MEYDYIIVGAGITGITAAEQLANVYDKKVLLIDKNDHIGGNCYDYYDESGILVHKYGPHIFHTNNEEVYSYLSLFTTWNVYNHKLVCNINNTVIPVPFNLISIDKTMQEDNQKITTALLTEYIVNDTLPLDKLKESKNPDIQKLVSYVNENIYTPYVKKIYGVDPELILISPYHMIVDIIKINTKQYPQMDILPCLKICSLIITSTYYSNMIITI